MISFFLLLLVGSAASVKVNSVHLPYNAKYISYTSGKDRIICNYTLDKGQNVSSVRWEILKNGKTAGTFEWKPKGKRQATGLLEKKVNLNRKDSDLEIISLAYHLNANYSCTVYATGNKTAKATGEILIIHICGTELNESLIFMEPTCLAKYSVGFSAVFPEPIAHTGVYDRETNQLCAKATKWNAVRHKNGSVQYSLKDFEYKVSTKSPYYLMIRTQLGVRKANGEYIAISKLVSKINAVHRCKDLRLGKNYVVKYNTDKRTCYGERHLPLRVVKARVSCAKGYKSKSKVTSVVMTCERLSGKRLRWIPLVQKIRLSDLTCVEK